MNTDREPQTMTSFDRVKVRATEIIAEQRDGWTYEECWELAWCELSAGQLNAEGRKVEA